MLEGKYQADVLVSTTGGKKTFEGVWTFNLIKRLPAIFSYPDSTYTIPLDNNDTKRRYSKFPVLDEDLKSKFYKYEIVKFYKIEDDGTETVLDTWRLKFTQRGVIYFIGKNLVASGEGNYGVDVGVLMKNKELDNDPPNKKIFEGAWKFEIKKEQTP
jgi:hypothetical protein